MTEGFEAELSEPIPPFLLSLPDWVERDIEVDLARRVVSARTRRASDSRHGERAREASQEVEELVRRNELVQSDEPEQSDGPEQGDETDVTEPGDETEQEYRTEDELTSEPTNELEFEYLLILKHILEQEEQDLLELVWGNEQAWLCSRRRATCDSTALVQSRESSPQPAIDATDSTFHPLSTSLFPGLEHTSEELTEIRRQVERRKKRLSMTLEKNGSIFQERRLYYIQVFEWAELLGKWVFVMDYGWPEELDSCGRPNRQGGRLVDPGEEFAYREPSMPFVDRSDCVCWVITDMFATKAEFLNYANPGVIMELKVLGEEMGDEIWEQSYFWAQTRRMLRWIALKREEQGQEWERKEEMERQWAREEEEEREWVKERRRRKLQRYVRARERLLRELQRQSWEQEERNHEREQEEQEQQEEEE